MILKAKNNYIIISLLGSTIAMALSIVLIITFMWAYFINDKIFSININPIGEANIEFIILLISLPLMFYSLIFQIKNIGKNKYEN